MNWKLLLVHLAVVAFFGLAAWTVFQIITPRVSPVLGAISAGALFVAGIAAYATPYLPPWMRRLTR